MGFLTFMRLQSRARRLGRAFDEARRKIFEAILLNVDRCTAKEDLSGQRHLGGQADLSLKGYQMAVLSWFLAHHPYVKDDDVQVFLGLLTIALCGDKQSEAQVYQLQFHEHRADIPLLMYEVAAPVADYLISGSEPGGRVFIPRFIPLFTISTQMEVAKEFGDKTTVRLLQAQMDEAVTVLTNRNKNDT
jgi:hypothetical protein